MFYVLHLEIHVYWAEWNSPQLPAVNTSWHLVTGALQTILRKPHGWKEKKKILLSPLSCFEMQQIFQKPLNRAIKEFHIILLESQKKNIKIKHPPCSQGMNTSSPFVIWHHKDSRNGCWSREEAKVKEQWVLNLCMTYFEDLICYIKWSRKKGSPMSIRSYTWF